MSLISFSANTLIKSSDVNANFQGLADGTLIGVGAITLGSAATTGQTGITSEVDVAGATVTITVPTGWLRNIEIYAFMELVNPTNTGSTATCAIYKDGVIDRESLIALPAAALGYTIVNATKPFVPTAGSHTYKLRSRLATGSGTITVQTGGFIGIRAL